MSTTQTQSSMPESAVRVWISEAPTRKPSQPSCGESASGGRKFHGATAEQAAALLIAAGLWLAPPAATADHVAAAVVYGAANPDLTALGRLDWAVWGWADDGTSASVNPSPRKKGATAISNLSWHNPSGGAFLNGRAALATHLLTWSDGAPTASAAGTTAGLRHQEFGGFLVPGGGFSLQVPAVRGTRKLTLFATAKDCTGRMTASVGSTSITRSLNGPVGTQAGVFEIHFHADAPGTNLIVEFAIDGPVSGCELAIHAVTLDEPYVIRGGPTSAGQALVDAIHQIPSGGRITFAPELDGQTIVIGELSHSIVIGEGVSIDASDLRGGVKVEVYSDRFAEGNYTQLPAFVVTSDGSLTLDSVEFTGVFRKSIILCEGKLTWSRGAITASGSDSLFWPLIEVKGPSGSVSLDRVTIADNPTASALGLAGGGQATLSSCTLTRNLRGVVNLGNDANQLTIRNSVVAGNLNESNVAGPHTEEGNNLLMGDPGLGPVKDNGGAVRTALPAPGSPAATGGDATVPGTPISDARGVVPTLPGQTAIGAAGPGTLVTTAADSGAGSLRDAIASTPAGGGIVVDPAVGLIQLTATLVLTKKVTLVGANLSGQGTVRPLQVAAGVDATVVDGSVTAGVSASGGGLANLGGVLDLRHGAVFGNTATSSFGGGISASTGSKTYLRGVSIRDNLCNGTTSSPTGAGYYASSNTQTWISNSTFSGNRIDNPFPVSGGGLSVGGTLTILNSTVSNNQAPRAAGLYLSSSSVTTIANTTITGNTALTGGGGIHLLGSLTIANSVIGGNTSTSGAPDLLKGTGTAAKLATEGANFLSTNTSIEAVLPAGPLVGTAAAPLAPRLTGLAPWVATAPAGHLPLPGSPLVCAAQPTLTLSLPATDQTGMVRYQTTTLGALEARPFSSLNLADLNGNGIGDLVEASYPPALGSGDLDGDGFADAIELDAMTDPTSGASFPQLTGLRPPLLAGGAWTIHGTSFPGVSYSIESSPEVGFANPQLVIEFTAEGLSFEVPHNPPPGAIRIFVRSFVNP